MLKHIILCVSLAALPCITQCDPGKSQTITLYIQQENRSGYDYDVDAEREQRALTKAVTGQICTSFGFFIWTQQIATVPPEIFIFGGIGFYILALLDALEIYPD